MNESISDAGSSSAGSLQEDLANLVIWAHTHGTICDQIPALEFMQNTDHLSNDNAVLWMCRDGHAYHWRCGKVHDTKKEDPEAVGRRKRLLSSESLVGEASFEEKKLKLSPSSLEMGQGDSGSTGSCDRSNGVTEQNDDGACTRNDDESRGSQNTGKPLMSYSAAEQHLSMPGRVQTEPSAEDLQILHCEKMALHQPTPPQRAAFSPTARPSVNRAYILQAPVSDPEDPSRNILRLAPFTAAGPMAETSRQRSPPGSAAPKVQLKPLPVPCTEAGAQPESQPLVTFFEFQATADVQQHLQLSPSECGTLGRVCSGDSAENVGENSKTLGSGQTPCSSATQNLESHAPAASNRDVPKKQKKKSCNTGDINMFKAWLKLHHPSETRKIHLLPPADLDRYLVSFFSSAKKQNGNDFSSNSLYFSRRNIDLYLKKHSYQYSMLKGPEFRASQEVWKSKHRYLFQKEREEEWTVVEKMTDEDVENLLKKGILSKMHPQGLLHLMFTNLIRGFGASTHMQNPQLYWGQLVLRKTNGEVEYLEWKDNLSPEGNEGELSPRLLAKPEDPENCPVASYKEYARKRPPDMLNDNHPLYLSPKALCSIWDKVWYSRKALAKTKMDKILKAIAQEVREVVKKRK